MKKVILSAVMVLALVAGSAFAASTQNKNAGGKMKPAAGGTMKPSSGKGHHKRHHKRHHKGHHKGSAKPKTSKNM